MSDENNKEEKKRPNAKYKLSHETVQDAEIVYHYNREHRLDKASQTVRELYEERPRRRGFLNSLFGTKPNAILFGTIIFLCLIMLMLSLLGYTGDSRELEGNILSVKGVKHEGTIIIEVRKAPRKDRFARYIQAYTGAVEVAVFPAAKKGLEQNLQATDIFFHKIFFTNDQEEHYYFTVPFEQSELGFIFRTEKKTLTLTVKVSG